MVRDLMSQMPVRHRMPYDEPVEGEDLFLLNRTASGLFTLKPNITMQPCLFYGDSDLNEDLQPEWSRFTKREEFIEQNVLREEFELVMQSHPLYKLFEQGIPTRKNPVRIINPFGNAMAYGFPSPMMPLTSSLDIAAFFATHRRDTVTGAWTAIPEKKESGEPNVGVLYILELALPFPMMLGLSVIGMQAFERTGRQRLFGLNVEAGRNFTDYRFVTGFEFKQCSDDTRNLGQLFNHGELLTPHELIADKARAILQTKTVSEEAFQLNCKNNPRDIPAENRKVLEKAGVKIVKEPRHKFTEDELVQEFYPTALQRWEEMFKRVIAVHPGFDRLLNDIRNFPNTAEGRQFFRR